MSFSQSIGNAQTPSVCQFCEESQEIKWKCINCELFLCQLCNLKIHSKSKASTAHEIINLKDINTENFAKSMRKVNLQNMQCIIHSKEKCFIYCKDCSEPVCSLCMIEVHQKHEYTTLHKVYEGFIADLKDVEYTIESNLQFFKKEKEKLQNMLSDGDTNFQETREVILQTETEMKEVISKNAKDLLQKLEAKWIPSENMIKSELSSLKKNEEELETRKNNIYHVLQSHQVADIFSTCKNLDKSLPTYKDKKIKICEAKFIPSNILMKIGGQMLGDICSIPDFEGIDTFQCENETVTNILFCTDNTAFTGSLISQKLQKVKFDKPNIKVKRELKIKVYDMAWTKDGEILVSSAESDLKIYTKDGQIKTTKSFPQLKTVGVHVSKDYKIIVVGLIESFTWPITKESIRRLVVMNQDGDIQHTIEHNKDNKRMLSFPGRINTFNDKIVVVDVLSVEFEGRVVMIDYGGQLNWTYDGCNRTNSDQVAFSPRDVAITSTENILVSDHNNHAIHVLNPAGNVIVYRAVKSLGIEFPLSLNIDKNGVLWIGCAGSLVTNKSRKAKIHSVKLI